MNVFRILAGGTAENDWRPPSVPCVRCGAPGESVRRDDRSELVSKGGLPVRLCPGCLDEVSRRFTERLRQKGRLA